MYKYSLFLLLSLNLLSADFTDLYIDKKAGAKAVYFVKIGAYVEAKNAKKEYQKSQDADFIVYLHKYYSILSQGYERKEDAQKSLKSLKQKYKDAYIITLYQRPDIKRVVSVEKVNNIPLSEFQKALGFYHDKQYEEALAGFDRALIEDENDLNAKIYYAMTLYKLGIYDEAKKVLKTIDVSVLNSQQTRYLKRLSQAIKAKTKRHFFKAILSIGAGYDDNINLTTDAKTTQYAGMTLVNDTNKSDSTYGLASLLLSHRYHADSFDVVSSLYSYNEFAHTVSGNDMNFFNISTGITKSINKWSYLFPVGVNGAYLDGEAVAYNFYTNPTISYHFTKDINVYWQAIYLDDTTKFMTDRDYTMLGANVGIVYENRAFKTGLQVGIGDVNQKKDVRFDIEKDVLNASVFGKYFIFSKRFIEANIGYIQDRYVKLDRAMGYKREDKLLNTGFTLGSQVGKHGTISLRYIHRKNDSNVNAYAYGKNIYTAEYKYKF